MGKDIKCLANAAAENDAAEIARILAAGIQPDAIGIGQGRFAQTPLTAAINRGHLDAARLILQAGADPNYPDARGHPINSAIDPESVELLLEYGSDPNAGFAETVTPFAAAALSPSRFDCAAAMLGRGGRADSRMLRMAASRGDARAAMLFSLAGASLDDVVDGETTLEFVARLLGPEAASAMSAHA